MAASASKPTSVEEEGRALPDPAVVQEVAAWVGQWARTLKSCRLYDAANPAVVRFREELAKSLTSLLAQRGPLRLEVGSKTLSYGGQQVHAAQSRDDNLAGALHRDGIRALTLEPGIESRELDSLLEQILAVTGPAPGEDDLVTLLWDAGLPHVAVETVPLEGEADGGIEDGADEERAAAWPRQTPGGAPPASGAAEYAASRSDDWATGEQPADLEQAFDQLETMALSEIARFQQAYEESVGENVVTEILQVLEDCLASELTEADRKELADFVPRVLREALGQSDWAATSSALRLLRTFDPEWSVEGFSRNLCGPFAIATHKVVTALDRQDAKGVEAFLAMVREFGAPLAEWLMHVLAESDRMHVRRPLARTIAELLAGHPEPIFPWLADERWYVVRNAVHILGWIGASDLPGQLQVVSEHPEPRVRREVVAALSQAGREASRPILVNMLKTADAALFGTILHQLALDDHPSIAEKLLQLLRDDTFYTRAEEERHALFLALATRGDPVLPALEAELQEGGLFSRRSDSDRAAIALCIARIGTPGAKAVLERGLQSKRGAVRKACVIAGASSGGSDG